MMTDGRHDVDHDSEGDKQNADGQRKAGMRQFGRLVARGRVYFDCGSVILGILDYSAPGAVFSPPTESVYFSTTDIERVHRRARKLGCLAKGLLHDDPASPLAEILVRPWGERSFYADDPSGNSLCFVDARTKFVGSPRQVAALKRAFG